MNRGIGLLLAMEQGAGNRERGTGNGDFVNRNINKCILGAGDATLIARHAYVWRGLDRAAALGDSLYRSALEWKFRPGDGPVCDWETARGAWLAAKDAVYAASDGSGTRRTLRSAARWVVRRRTFGEIATFGRDPVVRLLERVARCIRARELMSASLRRDWEIFN